MPRRSSLIAGLLLSLPGGALANFHSAAVLAVEQDRWNPVVERNADEVRPIASLTKLMTALVVLDKKLPRDEVITITDQDVDRVKHSSSRLKVGVRLTRDQALHLALMSSENRAAHALARTYPGGEPAFLKAMNTQAGWLGMKSTHYADPTGLSPENRSTARDLARLAHYAQRHYPRLRDLATDDQETLKIGKNVLEFHNTNPLVRTTPKGWQIGLSKTGYTGEAGRCLLMQARVQGRDLVLVTLGAPTKEGRLQDIRQIAQAKPGVTRLAEGRRPAGKKHRVGRA